MIKFYKTILTYFLLILFATGALTNETLAAAAEEKRKDKPDVLFSQNLHPSQGSYGGAELMGNLGKARISSCVSLGGSCIDKINSIIKEADEFVVSFMYRFNSPTLIKTLEEKHLNDIPAIVFLDYEQTYESSSEGARYPNYVRRLIDSVPTSLVKLGNKSFHQKVIISKKGGEQAIVVLGSANATFEADNVHSEDVVIIQSNYLAGIYLEEFRKLMRMEPQQRSSSSSEQEIIKEQRIKIFHEHRVKLGKSNIDLLEEFHKKLLPQDQANLDGHTGEIVSLAISTGFPDKRGNQTCLNIVNDVLSAPKNHFLFLFENFISLSDKLLEDTIGKNLRNETHKLIILDDNEYNKTAKQNLKGKNNNIIFFKPFTGGKFHHKLIIQYLRNEEPIVYTGSFHLSASAIQRNSENIIGIRSTDLADEYLASVLLNSELGEQSKVWEFISKFAKRLRIKTHQHQGRANELQESKVLQAARKLLKKCNDNMDRYLDRLERIETHLQLAASDADQQDEIKKYFENFIRSFSSDKLRSIEELKVYVFEESRIMKIYLSALQENWEIIKKEIPTIDEFIDKFPEFDKENLEGWFEKMDTWIEDLKEAQRYPKLKMKSELESIEKMHIALRDLSEYESTFTKLNDLHETLGKFIE